MMTGKEKRPLKNVTDFRIVFFLVAPRTGCLHVLRVRFNCFRTNIVMQLFYMQKLWAKLIPASYE